MTREEHHGTISPTASEQQTPYGDTVHSSAVEARESIVSQATVGARFGHQDPHNRHQILHHGCPLKAMIASPQAKPNQDLVASQRAIPHGRGRAHASSVSRVGWSHVHSGSAIIYTF